MAGKEKTLSIFFTTPRVISSKPPGWLWNVVVNTVIRRVQETKGRCAQTKGNNGYCILDCNYLRVNEWGFRLNWARSTSRGWWDEWDDTALQTQDSKFEIWQSEAEHTTSRLKRLPTNWIFTIERRRNNWFVSLKLACQSRGRARDLRHS